MGQAVPFIRQFGSASVGGCGNSGTALAALDDTDGNMAKIYGWHLLSAGIFQAPWSRTNAKRVSGCAGRTRGLGSVAPHRGRSTQQPPAGRTTPATVYKCALSKNSDRAHYPRFPIIRSNSQSCRYERLSKKLPRIIIYEKSNCHFKNYQRQRCDLPNYLG